MDEKRQSEFIRAAYDMVIAGGTEGQDWNGLLARLNTGFEGVTALLQIADSRLVTTRYLGSANIDPVSGQLYQQYYFGKDLFVTRSGPPVLDRSSLSQDFLSDAEMLNSEIYTDLFRPRLNGVFHNIGIGGRIDASRTLLLGVQRDRRRGIFDAREAQIFESLWQHLLHAMRLRDRVGLLETSQGITAGILDHLTVAAIVLRGDARLVFANHAARRLFEQTHALRLTTEGRVALSRPSEHQRFTGMIGRIIREQDRPQRTMPPEQMIWVSRAEQAAPLALLAVPFQPPGPAHGEPRPAMALLLVTDPAANPGPLAQRARALFGLTDAEATLAEALAGGATPEDVARRRAIRISTVRSQLQSLFAKTGTRRQGELLRLLLSLPQSR